MNSKIENSRKKITILQLLPSLELGGVERGVIDIALYANKINQQSADIEFVQIVASSGGSLVKKLEEGGGKHLTLPVCSKNPFKILANVGLLKKIIRQYDIDIIHARSRAPAWSAYLACKKTNCKFLTTFHGFYSNKLPFLFRFFKHFYNKIMTKGERVIAVSNFVKEHIEETYKTDQKKISVIHRGTDLNYFNPDNVSEQQVEDFKKKHKITEARPIIFMPARITPWKGQDFLLRAMSAINQPYYCIFAGNSFENQKYYAELKEFILRSSMSDKVKFIGKSDDMVTAYKVANVVVVASQRGEAFGRVATEAQAMGKPVVATNHGGAIETIIDGETGKLVGVFSTSDMTKAITKYMGLGKGDNLLQLAKSRKNVVDNFSLEKMCSKTYEIYKNLCN